MGSCVSFHKGSSQSGMVLKESVESLGNDKAQASHAGGVSTFRNLNNCQEDMFVDSQLSFDSDCENFISVSDGLSPSHDISPLPQNGSSAGATVVKSPLVVGTYDTISQSSPPAEKKKLVELLHNSAGGNQSDNEQRLQDSNDITCSERPEANEDLNFNLSQKAVNESSCASVDKLVCDIERKNLSGNPVTAKNLTESSGHGCLACVVHSLTYSEKEKKKSTSAGEASFSSAEPIC